jgi:diguanylate cyclase (GGDEF)-like protein/PAS domain S-box-containing protein
MGQVENRLTHEELLRFRAAMDMSGDAIYLVDRTTMRFVDVNHTACTRMGYSREELLQMGPQDLLSIGRAEIERLYDEVIATGASGTTAESSARAKDGRESITELHRRALRTEDGWIIVSIARDITRRKSAEQVAARQGRLYAALSATNAAIMYAKSPQELYQQVCDAAVDGGKFVNAMVLLPGAEEGRLRIAAVADAGKQNLRDISVSVDGKTLESGGLVGAAFRARQPSVSNNFLQDERMRLWHDIARKAGIEAAAAIPLVRGGRAVGALLFYSGERRAFGEELVLLLERVAENISFALDNFDRETERERNGKALQHANLQLEQLALHDPLTGLANRRKFADRFAYEMARAGRIRTPPSLLMVDVDHFKGINDRHGHLVGDACLKELAALLTESVREVDLVARFGGEEFVVLLPETSMAQSLLAAERMRCKVQTQPIGIGDGVPPVAVTISVGAATAAGAAPTLDEILARADEAVYRAKSAGRNQVCS